MLKIGRIDYDGRPIFGMSCPEFVDIMKGVDKDIEIVPAHIWTPHFGLLGSKGGFNSVKEAFAERTKDIHAVETGLSSDPDMNFRIPELDDYTLLSFSDLHSYWPWRLGREATVFDLNELTYDNVLKAIKTKEGLKETIEVDPGYGKYHYDGHRNCNVSLSPSESNKLNKMCPKCGRPLIIGVENRVEELAKRPIGYKLEDAPSYKKYIPLSDMISLVLEKGVATKSVWTQYNKVVGKIGNEYEILRSTPKEKLEKYLDKKIVDAIIKNRNQQIKVIPGYDGVYGVPVLGDTIIPEPEIFEPSKIKNKQMGLQEYFS